MAMINSLNYGNDVHTFTLPYGVCSTAAGTAAKTVTVDNFSLETGAAVIVKFTNSNSASSPTLNVNGTGAKPIMRYGTTAASTETTTSGWIAGAVQLLIYDGTNWIRDYWNNTTYSNVALGQGYATCSTAEATTAKVGTLSSYALTTGGIVSVKFTYAVPASSTLNINSKGAKAIYHKGAAIKAGVIKAGDTATFIYNGTYYHLIAVDRDDNTTYSVATTSANGLMSSTDKSKLDGIATGANKYTHPSYTAKSSGLYKVTVDANGHVSAATAVAKSDITGLGIPAQDTTYSAATTSAAGLMSATDKSKLDGIATGANKTTVDSALSSTSTNPVQNKVINSALDSKADASTLENYLPLTGGTLSGHLTIERTANPQIKLVETTGNSRAIVQNHSHAATLEIENVAGDASNKRLLLVTDSDTRTLAEGVRFRDITDGTEKNYKIFGDHNLTEALKAMFPSTATATYIPVFGSNWESRGYANVASLLTAMGGLKCETKTYTGTGTKGKSSSPAVTLTFSKQPKVVMIGNTSDSGTNVGGHAWVYGAKEGITGMSTSSVKNAKLTWNGTKLSWYCSDEAEYGLNKSGSTYTALAFY